MREQGSTIRKAKKPQKIRETDQQQQLKQRNKAQDQTAKGNFIHTQNKETDGGGGLM